MSLETSYEEALRLLYKARKSIASLAVRQIRKRPEFGNEFLSRFARLADKRTLPLRFLLSPWPATRASCQAGAPARELLTEEVTGESRLPAIRVFLKSMPATTGVEADQT